MRCGAAQHAGGHMQGASPLRLGHPGTGQGLDQSRSWVVAGAAHHMRQHHLLNCGHPWRHLQRIRVAVLLSRRRLHAGAVVVQSPPLARRLVPLPHRRRRFRSTAHLGCVSVDSLQCASEGEARC